jgi:hypothetical protein
MIASRAFLAPALLSVGVLFLSAAPASAQARTEERPAPVTSPQDAARPDATEIKVMGRWLMERVEAHRRRLVRLDKLLEFHRAKGDLAKIREVERLRQREITAFQKTLSEYRSQLGNQNFERLARAVRFLMDKERRQRAGVWNKDGGDEGVTRERAALADTGGTQGRREAAAPARRLPTPSTERSLDRQLEVERARASQRMQLAQRLQQARQEQLRLMAEQQRRYRPSAGPGPQGGGPVRPSGAGQQGGPTRRPGATPQRPPQRPPQRRPR